MDEKTLQDYIDYYSSALSEIQTLYLEYCGDVDIYDRTFESRLAVNYQLNFPFRNLVVDQVCSFLAGKKIKYFLNEKNYTTKKLYKEHSAVLTDFIDRINTSVLDMSTLTMMACCGYGVRLVYIDSNGNENIKNINPWECVWVQDEYGKDKFAIRYFKYTDLGKDTYYAEVYTDKTIEYFKKDDTGSFVKTNTVNHYFGIIPLIKFRNNELESSDFELIRSICDAINVVGSDMINELTEHRTALLKVTADISAEDLLASKNDSAGAIIIPDKEGSVDWLIKQLPTEYLKQVWKILNEMVYVHSSSVNFSDENFSGGYQSGEGRKWKVLQLLQRATAKGNYFREGCKKMFTAVCNTLNMRGIEIFSEEVEIEFTHNLPIDIEYYSQIFANLYNKLPYKTLLSFTPFVTDPSEIEDVAEQQKKEEAENTNKIEI